MDVDIRLQYQYGYEWFSNDGVWVKGFVYDEHDVPLRGGALAAFFKTAVTEEDFNALLKKANGLFAVIIQTAKNVFFAVDRTRTFPLFYALQQGKLVISDAAAACTTHLQPAAECMQEFLFTGYVTGPRTLLKDVCQVQAGAAVVYDNGHLHRSFYYCYVAGIGNPAPFGHLAEQLKEIMIRAGQRMVNCLNGRTAVVPLSGGYDSRLIAVLLRMLRYPKVICFTYGTKMSPDVRISRKVAAQLGFPWHFIPYNSRTIGDFPQEEAFLEYIRFALNDTSMPFVQDYFAVRELKNKGSVPEDAVFIPGHTSNFVAGVDPVHLTADNVAATIVKKLYQFKKEDTAAYIKKIALVTDVTPFENFENWKMKERQSKFIINSNRIYEFWGFEHLLPLWDKELALFFQNLLPEHRMDKRLFSYVAFRYFFIPLKVGFRSRKYSPFIQKGIGAVKYAYRWLVSDQNNFRLIARRFQKNIPTGIAWNARHTNINSIQTAWYIAWLGRRHRIKKQSPGSHN